MILLLDVANTLIHKPALFANVKQILTQEGYDVKVDSLVFHHKLVSELITFPDRTSETFYWDFNREWLYSLGILATDKLLNTIYSQNSYLPWVKFDDVSVLDELQIQKAVLSNFHTGLNAIAENLFAGQFSMILSSENAGLRKPDPAFYRMAVEQLAVTPADIIYIGDSIKLDLEPALKIGMNAWLLDRNNFYPHCQRRLSHLSELKSIIKSL